MQIIAYKISIYSLFTSCSVPFDVRRACTSYIDGCAALATGENNGNSKKK